jgi:hypothetical protein
LFFPGLPEEFKGRRRKSFGQKDGDEASSRYEEREKVVLEGILFGVFLLSHFVLFPCGQSFCVVLLCGPILFCFVMLSHFVLLHYALPFFFCAVQFLSLFHYALPFYVCAGRMRFLAMCCLQSEYEAL